MSSLPYDSKGFSPEHDPVEKITLKEAAEPQPSIVESVSTESSHAIPTPSIYTGEFSHLHSPIAAGYLNELSEAVQAEPNKFGFDRPITETPYRVWEWFTGLSSILNVVIWITFVLGMLLAFSGSYSTLFGGATTSATASLGESISEMLNSGLRNAGSMSEVLQILPIAALMCVATTAAVGYVSRNSKSRKIDWTDSHLMLEHSGPISLALKWQSIKQVRQEKQWELFHGHQPVFVVETHKGKVFRLRLSDITQKHNIGEFFSLIKTNAPHAQLNVAANFANDNSYTELWLKYFSTPAERRNVGLLQKEMVLDNGHYIVVGTVGGGGQGTAYLAAVRDEVSRSSNASISTDANSASHGEIDAQSSVTTNNTTLVQQPVEHIMEPRVDELLIAPHVVLKEYVLPVHRGQLTAERTAEKLKGEAKILQALQHPQIVKLLDAFIEDYRGYLVLEYVNGESLKDMVDRLGPQPPEQAVSFVKQVCDILMYLHNQSPPVVHRDITPDNLMLQENGEIKVVDFNVACQVDLSATATVVGKHAYIPAEQFRGKPTTQSDIYALGGTLFYLLTAQEPEPITPSHPRALNELVSPELDDVVAKATASKLADRFATVEDFAAALTTLLPDST